MTLPGRPLVQGRALGALGRAASAPRATQSALPRGRGAKARFRFRPGREGAAGLRGARQAPRGSARRRVSLTYLQIVGDARLRGRATELVAGGAGVAARARAGGARGDARGERASRAIPSWRSARATSKTLCDAVVMLASNDPRVLLPSKAVLMGDQLTVFDLLISARAQPTALALTERAVGPRTSVLLQLLEVPALSTWRGSFAGHPRATSRCSTPITAS